MVLLNLAITDDDDDGYDTGAAWLPRPYGGQDLFIIKETAGTSWQGGVRFQSVTIAQGATIDDATLTFNAVSRFGTYPTTITAYGDDVDNAAAFGSSSRPQSGWTDTTASAANSSLPTPENTFTIDVTSIVQEIVNRGSWSSGNAMRFRLEGSGGTYGGWNLSDFDSPANGDEAQLDINYTVGGGATPKGPFSLALMGSLGGPLA